LEGEEEGAFLRGTLKLGLVLGDEVALRVGAWLETPKRAAT
jgi:hypothetical protein